MNTKQTNLSANKPRRDLALDEMRGWAVFLMIGFHFAYDLNFFGFVSVDFFSPAFLVWRYIIVFLFLTSVGVSMVLSYKNIAFLAYTRRLGKLLAAAMAISVGTYFVFPDNAVLFGILHLILVASVVGYFFIGRPRVALLVGVGILLLNLVFINQPDAFNDIVTYNNIIQWQETYYPAYRGVDYYPPMPWLAWVLIGIFVGYHRSIYQSVFVTCLGWVLFMGRHALAIYLLHQLVLFSATYGVYWLLYQ